MGARGLTREEILAAQDITTEAVPVPEWGGTGTVYVAILPGADRWELDVALARANAQEPTTDFVANLLALAIVDEQGARVFTQDDIKALGKKSGVVLTRLFRVAMRLNGIGAAEVERTRES